MNLADFSREFDLFYNNSLNFEAPPINIYEKSLYLTKAQEEIVKGAYNLTDKDEKSREILRNLTINKKILYDATLNSNLASLRFNTNSKLFDVGEGIWFLVAEKINDDDSINVVPVPIDEYKLSTRNPFKRPTLENIAWRLDVSDSISATPKNIRELIYPGSITSYTIRYIKRPTPIILESLTPYGVTIEGLSAATSCSLSETIHRDIIKRAVDLAILTYEEKNLQNRVQVG